jgi:hypothetical protein
MRGCSGRRGEGDTAAPGKGLQVKGRLAASRRKSSHGWRCHDNIAPDLHFEGVFSRTLLLLGEKRVPVAYCCRCHYLFPLS